MFFYSSISLLKLWFVYRSRKLFRKASQYGVGLSPVIKTHFPKPFLTDINVEAIIQVHHKLSWDFFPKTSSKLVSRRDVLLLHPFSS